MCVMAKKRKRGRPPMKITPPIPDTFENVLKAVVQPMAEPKREEITRQIEQEKEGKN